MDEGRNKLRLGWPGNYEPRNYVGGHNKVDANGKKMYACVY